ncbi:hypothetical protein DPMN_159312 [Dreissena polymorpha]|uniref:Uncharacterized protein n=1 Tax=Dreissena polymorpha TaxID=45954 RepID=A0A9D4EJI8_DREPO|nr:hypothetical protein DPMN_159312 [Dreissena polymorpha]
MIDNRGCLRHIVQIHTKYKYQGCCSRHLITAHHVPCWMLAALTDCIQAKLWEN